jgi:cytochrome b6-f complex iron-sulfur subunit
MVHSEGEPIIVIRRDESKFLAFSAKCTHLGCIVNWDDSQKTINCPCHAGVFSAEGKPVSGPPPKPLKEYKVVVVGKEVQIKMN